MRALSLPRPGRRPSLRRRHRESRRARTPGVATVRGVFGYVGRPFTRLERGEWTETHGWMDLQRHRFPSPLGRRWLGSCDVPDLAVFPERYPGVETVTFHAGFASATGHFTVFALAALVRARLLRSAAPFAAPLGRLSQRLEPLISHRGGMFVTLEGIGHDGATLSLSWNLLAARNHGPQIPCGAAIALVRKLASGVSLPSGARPCVGLLSVEEYLEPLRELDVHEVPSWPVPAGCPSSGCKCACAILRARRNGRARRSTAHIGAMRGSGSGSECRRSRPWS